MPRGLSGYRRPLVAVLITCMLCLPSATGFGQDRDVVLRAEFPADMAAPPSVAAFSGVVDPQYVARVPDVEAAASILEEACWTFAGMIWGFDYSYTPSDKVRAIDERFDIRPRSPEAIAAMRLQAASARLEGSTLLVTVEFYPEASARTELASWKTVSAAAQGLGSAPMLAATATGPKSQVEARREATTVAIREALRAYLRTVTHNKPREVLGSFSFYAPPRIFARDGSWVSIVRLYTRVDQILSYGAY
jgi:hypothetical protein